MARKNRSNNTFAPIVITVLVAGVVGYYLVINPPRSTQAEGDIQSESAPLDPRSDQDADSSRESEFLFKRPVAPSPAPTGEARGSDLDTTPDPSRSPLDPPQKRTPNAPLALDADPLGLGPTPTEFDSGSNVPNANNPTNAEAKPSTSAESGGEQSEPVVPAEPNSEPKTTAAPVAKPKPVASTEVYTVQDGDFLITIAEDWFGEPGRHDEIIALNPGVDPTRLQIGQTLKMPRKSQPRTKPVDPTLAANEYRISPNDNFTKIARLLLGDEARASEIAALNPDLDPGNLQVGTVIKLPPKQIKKPEPRPVKRPPLRTGEKYYTVKSGDSLARIVGDFWGVQREDWVELLYLRNKDTIGEDRTKLNLDQVLIIPVKPKS
ncbi:MAG: LysM peptidoglycan-binding domain-containing protein [Planctomycetota bacterium]|nr:LysM peptidoglycan-binding domain-containing protein [Planctomycetota bacterium]